MEGQRVSHYRILHQLGSGGMGEVYAAEDERLRRRVAIKFISQQVVADDEIRRRFEREAQTASALNRRKAFPRRARRARNCALPTSLPVTSCGREIGCA
jgi:serine/threonine protein kinase